MRLLLLGEGGRSGCGDGQNEEQALTLIDTSPNLPHVFLAWGSYDYRDPLSEIHTPELSRTLHDRLQARGVRVSGGERAEGSLFSYWAERLPSMLAAFTSHEVDGDRAAPSSEEEASQ